MVSSFSSDKDSEFKTYHQNTDGLPYDFKSVMHYKNKAFSKNERNTVTALNDPKRTLGKRNDFSALDIVRVNKLYSCSDYLQRDCE